MPAVYEWKYTVPEDDIDGMGHVNNMAYVKWLVTVAVDHSSVQGWPPERYHELGYGWVVRRHIIEYLLPAFQGEDLVIQTWISELKRVKCQRKYRIVRPSDGKKLVTAVTDWAFVSRETQSICRVPEELTTAFAVVAGDDEPN